MASSTLTKLSHQNGMTTQEKIQQAEKRIKELERLIAYWKNDK
jgi:hypothetical protein|tara:strand:+ start:4686 stop:4814 length:129 start_codon:yes stop_codon:yes gene_type:complete